jgi:thymidylate synthase
MVNAWNVGELDQMVLPPCHYGFQVYTRELSLEERRKLANHDSVFISPITVESWDRANIPTRAISLMWNQRSVDTFLGLPFNIASYGLLLTILAKEVNMVPDQLIGNLGDTHLYLNHIEQAKEQIGREPFELPTLNQFPTYEGSRPSIESYVVGDFTLKDYQSHPSIKAPLSN